MKFNKHVSRSRRKARRRFFTAPSHVRRNIMCAAVSKQICKEYGVPRLSIPIRKEDTVKVVRGKYKTEQANKVTNVNRKKYRLLIEGINRDKANGSQVKVPIHYSNVVITKLKLDAFRKTLIKRLVANKRKARERLGLDPSGAKKQKPKKEQVTLD